MTHAEIAKLLPLMMVSKWFDYLDDNASKESKDTVKSVYSTFKSALKDKRVSYSLIMDVFLFDPKYKGQLEPGKAIYFLNSLAYYVKDTTKYTVSYLQTHINYKRNHNTRVSGQSVKIVEIFPNAFAKVGVKDWKLVY